AVRVHIRHAQRAVRGARREQHLTRHLLRGSAPDAVPRGQCLAADPQGLRGAGVRRRCAAGPRQSAHPQGAVMREALRRILILCRKETLAIFKDPRSRIILFVPVVLQSLLFGYAASYDLDHAPYALLDEDRSAASRELVERIEAGGVFRRVADLRTASEIAPVINRREALFVLHIGPQFERTLSGGAE